VEKAFDMLKFSYCLTPISVGAAIFCADGSVFTGCNVENAAMAPPSARSAPRFYRAVSEGHRDDFASSCHSGQQQGLLLPCGSCRQMLMNSRRA
jgi:cytidine deaminase